MKTLRAAAALLALSMLALPAHAAMEASWTATIDTDDPTRMYLNIARGRNHNNGSTMMLADFAGLSTAQVQSTTSTPVQFALRREAGTASFEGTFRNGKGAGHLTFAGNRAFFQTLRGLGVDPDLGERQSEEETLFALAIHDVSSAFIRSMQAEGYRVPLGKYVALRIFRVTPEYIREMRSLGFNDLDVDDLLATRIHKVTPDYIRQMRAAGWDLSMDDLQASRIHGATPEFAAAMHKLGYDLDFDDLVSFRIHRVTPDFIAELRNLGYKDVPADDLVAMRIHRVTPEFIRELEAAGYTGVPVSKLVSMRIHGVDAKFVRKMRDR